MQDFQFTQLLDIHFVPIGLVGIGHLLFDEQLLIALAFFVAPG